jgi:hypothetical protein
VTSSVTPLTITLQPVWLCGSAESISKLALAELTRALNFDPPDVRNTTDWEGRSNI